MIKGYNPYANGRWYKFFIESDGSVITLDNGDIEAIISGGYLKMPAGFHVIDKLMDIHSVEGGTAANVGFVNRIYSDGIQATDLPPVANFDYATIWLFGYFD